MALNRSTQLLSKHPQTPRIHAAKMRSAADAIPRLDRRDLAVRSQSRRKAQKPFQHGFGSALIRRGYCRRPGAEWRRGSAHVQQLRGGRQSVAVGFLGLGRIAVDVAEAWLFESVIIFA
jgi:hypothetical protein